MNNKLLTLLLLLLTANDYVFSQSFAINTDGSIANASALLDVKSNTKGILVPRLTSTEKNSITAPATGLLIFQTGPDSVGFHYYTGTKWTWILSNANTDSLVWKTTGNNSITDATNFIGTINNVPFNIRVNNQKAGRIESNNVTANTFYGYLAGKTNTTGWYNTAVGFQALFNNNFGDENTANGGEALYSNTSGSYNNALGYHTLYNNTTGSFNNAIGTEALSSNTLGNANTANGYQALSSNTTGNANTANGFQALSSNTIGFYNSANGYQALSANSIGSYNSAYGYQSLYTNTTGDNNTANGVFSLYHNTIGLSNNANGYQALYNNTTGNRNTAIGNDALLSNINGSQNTTIGYQAGYSLTSGSNNVFLGSQAGYGETTGSNKLYIANSNINPPLIFGDFTSARVGIGSITPLAGLDVASDFKLGINGVKNNALIRATVTINLPSISADTDMDVTVSVPNAIVAGSAVFISPVADIETGLIIAWARVSAAGTVKIRFRNSTNSTITPVPIDYVISVLQ